MKICWLLEKLQNNNYHLDKIRRAALNYGYEIKLWSPKWDSISDLELLSNFSIDTKYIFWGSLNVAKRLYIMHPNIISFCNVDAFACSSFYIEAKNWILNKDWELTTAIETVGKGPFFIRPNDALKSFSGRVLNKVTLKDLDFGIYYQDEKLPVITSSIKGLSPDEWRFVIINQQIVTGSPKFYGSNVIDSFRAREFADRAVRSFCAPEMVWTVDIGKYKDEYYIIEANPFSGASLYECDLDILVKRISEIFQ